MKRHRRRPKRQVRAIRLWSYPEAAKALPYLRSLTDSLRGHWLELQERQLAARRLNDLRKPTRSDRIALEDAQEDARRAEEHFDDALEELMRLDIFLLDPVRGLALIPFQQEEELAWYVFDLFDKDGLTSWRYHKDPLDTRRPVPRNTEVPIAKSVVV
jgi:uncharacterized protein DUF2203